MKKNKHACDLQSCSFCTGCLPEWLPALDIHRKTLHVKKGEIIFQEGAKVTGVYFVNTGIVKVHKQWGDDKELIVRFAGKGDIVGHRGLGTDDLYPVSGTALEPSTVCFVDIDFFMTSLKVNQDYLFKLMMFFADELKLSERKMRNLAHMPVKGRVAQALITLEEKFGTTEDGFIKFTLSRQDLASYAGATYETVFRVINELVSDKAIVLQGKNIAVPDKEKLYHYLKETE